VLSPQPLSFGTFNHSITSNKQTDGATDDSHTPEFLMRFHRTLAAGEGARHIQTRCWVYVKQG
jgi:hypothetical protein